MMMENKTTRDPFALVGYRAYFRHENGDEYTMLVKGDPTLVEAAQVCEREMQEHGASLYRLERWDERVR